MLAWVEYMAEVHPFIFYPCFVLTLLSGAIFVTICEICETDKANLS